MTHTDTQAWVGRALLEAIQKGETLAMDVVKLVQAQAGPGRAGVLINALKEAGVSLTPLPKREASPAQLANLAKARAARGLNRPA